MAERKAGVGSGCRPRFPGPGPRTLQPAPSPTCLLDALPGRLYLAVAGRVACPRTQPIQPAWWRYPISPEASPTRHPSTRVRGKATHPATEHCDGQRDRGARPAVRAGGGARRAAPG